MGRRPIARASPNPHASMFVESVPSETAEDVSDIGNDESPYIYQSDLGAIAVYAHLVSLTLEHPV
jgi:hypothetical protein